MSIFILIVGLLIGSFLNVCIYRIPLKESIAFPPSHCPSCGTSLKPVDLIPVLSYLFCRGRCRYCQGKISIQYPIIETANAIIYLLIFLKYGYTLEFAGLALLGSLLLVVAVIDLQTQEIPNELMIFGLICGIIFNLLHLDLAYFLQSISGLVLGGGIFLLIAVVSRGAMGGGDIKLMGVLGFWLGWKLILIVAMLSFLIGAVISVGLMILKIRGRKDYIPFGPFITLAAWIVIYQGAAIWTWYMRFLI